MDYKEIEEILGRTGKMISGSKSGYYDNYPNNLAIFNANLCTKNAGKIWYGDIDVTLEKDKIVALAGKLKQDIYVLREMDARFENENKPNFKNFAAIISPDGNIKVGELYYGRVVV